MPNPCISVQLRVLSTSRSSVPLRRGNDVDAFSPLATARSPCVLRVRRYDAAKGFGKDRFVQPASPGGRAGVHDRAGTADRAVKPEKVNRLVRPARLVVFPAVAPPATNHSRDGRIQPGVPGTHGANVAQNPT